MSSATSIEGDPPEAPFALWHIYALLGMLAAAASVWVSRNTHPLALVLLSLAAIAASVVALAVHRAVAAFLGRGGAILPLREHQRDVLEREKALVLRSIKELEFDRAMKKIGEADYAAISSRLRARALTLMQDLQRTPATPASQKPKATTNALACPTCGTQNDSDAKFCKKCGQAIAQ